MTARWASRRSRRWAARSSCRTRAPRNSPACRRPPSRPASPTSSCRSRRSPPRCRRSAAASMIETDAAGFEALLHFLQQQRGFDFTGYKRPSLMRRVARRMQTLAIKKHEDYQDHLQVHPEEFALLFDTILINVTSFFRDPQAWECVRDNVLPPLLAAKSSDGAIRIWSAGCASGEEAYTVAMLFAEALGEREFHERVKVYGTDADEHALSQARLARYAEKELEGVEPALREKYFEHVNGRYTFSTDLRRAVIFGRHDLVQDAPISRLDLIVCRNTLMYFNAETQSRVLARFHFA